MPQALCLFGCRGSPAFRAEREDVSNEALVSALPSWGARRYLTGAFAPRLWGCLRRFACLRAQHHLRSEQFVRMFWARRWFRHPSGRRRGVLLGRVRAQIVRMPQAVCLLAYPTSLAFGGVCEDVSSQALVSVPPGGAPGRILHGRVLAQIVGMS